MFDMSFPSKAYMRLGPTALRAVETMQAVKGIHIEPGAVQIMVFYDSVGQIGGLSTQPRGQYILKPAAEGRISDERLIALGFQCTPRSDGSFYWYRARHDDFHSYFAAISEITGVVL